MEYLIAFFIISGFFLIALFGIFFIIRSKIQGKTLAFIVDKDKSFHYYLFKPEGKFIKFKNEKERYLIEPTCVMYTKYPFGLFKFIQQNIPCLVYAKGNPQPLSPDEISKTPKGLTAKMVESTVNENIVAGIVESVSPEQKKSAFPAWFFPAITIFLIVCLAGYIYFSNTSMMEAIIKLTPPV